MTSTDGTLTHSVLLDHGTPAGLIVSCCRPRVNNTSVITPYDSTENAGKYNQ